MPENNPSPYSDFNREPPPTNYTVDLKKAGEIWKRKCASLSDLFSTRTGTVVSPTHMLGQPEDKIRLIAYSSPDKTRRRGDESEQTDLARFILPGEFAIAIKHHSPKPNRKIVERMKLQCTHIQVAIGVKKNGKAGVIAISNPQNYYRRKNNARVPLGLFGTEDYPAIFIKPKFPDDFSPELKRQYLDNIRAWLIIANTFTRFPDEDRYNGNDPLMTINLRKIKILGDKLLQALNDKTEAAKWFYEAENRVYCGELAHIALNLGIYHPLNKTFLGEKWYEVVRRQFFSKKFLKYNSNRYVPQVSLEMAPETLEPITSHIKNLSENLQALFDPHLAIQPFAMVEIMEKYIQKTIPRELLGEKVASAQAELLSKTRLAFWKTMEIDKLSEEDFIRAEMDTFFRRIVQAVGSDHGSYQKFGEALRPLLREAHYFMEKIGVELNAFIPPHCFLVRATNSLKGEPGQGVLGWQYLGHGLHECMLIPKR